MLSSAPSSLLLSTALSPADAAPGTAGPFAGGVAAPGFAEVLKGRFVQAKGLSPSAGLPAEAATVATANELPAAAPGPFAAAEDAPALIADLGKAATASGKVLPVALPEAAETAAAPGTPAKDAPEEGTMAQTDDPAAAVVDLLLPLLGPAFAPTLPAAFQTDIPDSAEPVIASAALAALRAGGVLSVNTSTAPAASLSRLSAKTAPRSQATDGQATEPRNAGAVPISVAAPSAAAPPVQATPLAAGTPIDPAAAIPQKPVRAAEPRRLEAPASGQHVSSSSLAAAQPDSASPVQAAQVTSASAPAPSPVDINAALDRLVAARAALLPAETALAVDHAEFGEVTIRFEQSTGGRLSAELRAADPELQRAVTAALAADRSLSGGVESDGGRSTGTANPRGSTGDGEATPGERGQRGNDREMNSRRTPGRPQAEPGTADPHAGVFA